MVAALKSLGPSSMFSLPHCWCLKSELEREGWKGEDDRIKWNVLYSANWENVVILFFSSFFSLKCRKRKKIGELLRFMSYLWSRIFNAFFPPSIPLPLLAKNEKFSKCVRADFQTAQLVYRLHSFLSFLVFSPNTLCSSSLYNRLSAQLCSGERWLVEEINFTENFLLRSSSAASFFYVFRADSAFSLCDDDNIAAFVVRLRNSLSHPPASAYVKNYTWTVRIHIKSHFLKDMETPFENFRGWKLSHSLSTQALTLTHILLWRPTLDSNIFRKGRARGWWTGSGMRTDENFHIHTHSPPVVSCSCCCFCFFLYFHSTAARPRLTSSSLHTSRTYKRKENMRGYLKW